VLRPGRTPMTGPRDGLGPLNELLNEIIDVVREVRVARWRFSAAVGLNVELDALLNDARSWSRLIIEQDEEHGVSPVGLVPTAAGRGAIDLGPDGGTAEGVRAVLSGVLQRLADHIAEVLVAERDESVRAALAEVARGVATHRQALGAFE
jgi:hypothetical protein